MLSVGFDGRALASPAAGVRRYAFELFGALAALRSVRVVAVGPRADTDLPAGVEAGPDAASLPTNIGWMVTGLPRAARRAGIDVFHAPSYTAPIGGPRPLVLTIHDVSYERHPEWYPYRRDPFRRAFYRRSARSADRIITDSSFSKAEIIAAYGVSPDFVDVVPLAAAPGFTRQAAGSSSDRVRAPYVLHVGDLHPRRNLEVAVHAVLDVRRRRAEYRDLQLVLAGVDRSTGPVLEQLAQGDCGDPPPVHRAGHVTDEALRELYRGAAALVYPSRYEGFGLPLLEAMACGTPVIAANAASIPEVTGDAAILLDPDDEPAWVSAIEAVLTGETATRLRAAGVRRAGMFSWRRTAEATLAAYERALPAAAR